MFINLTLLNEENDLHRPCQDHLAIRLREDGLFQGYLNVLRQSLLANTRNNSINIQNWQFLAVDAMQKQHDELWDFHMDRSGHHHRHGRFRKSKDSHFRFGEDEKLLERLPFSHGCRKVSNGLASQGTSCHSCGESTFCIRF